MGRRCPFFLHARLPAARLLLLCERQEAVRQLPRDAHGDVHGERRREARPERLHEE